MYLLVFDLILHNTYLNLIVVSTRFDEKNHIIYIYINERENKWNNTIKTEIQSFAKEVATSYDIHPVIILDEFNGSKSIYTYRY